MSVYSISNYIAIYLNIYKPNPENKISTPPTKTTETNQIDNRHHSHTATTHPPTSIAMTAARYASRIEYTQ